MRPVAEDPLDELGEHAAGADLDERAHAARVHRLDLLDEAHRLRELRRQALAHRVGIATGTASASALPIHGDRRRRRPRSPRGTRGTARSSRPRAGCGTRSPPAAASPVIPCAASASSTRVDRLGRAREHDLRRAVVVGDHHLARRRLGEHARCTSSMGRATAVIAPGSTAASRISSPRRRATATQRRPRRARRPRAAR